MGESELSDNDFLDHPAGDSIILVGEPKALRGSLRLRNPRQEKLVLREALIRSVPPKAKTSAPVLAVPFIHGSLSAVLQPGQTERATLSVELDHHTPPGEYHGMLEVAGSSRPVVLYVTEMVRLEISPRPIVIADSAGATVVKRVVFSNNGNVPLTIDEIGEVLLGEELMLRQTLHATFAETGGQTLPLERLVGDVFREARTIVKPVDPLPVHNLAGRMLLQPGEVKAIDLEIYVPDTLSANSRYLGRAPLYTSDLEFVIVPAAGEQAPRARSQKHVKKT